MNTNTNTKNQLRVIPMEGEFMGNKTIYDTVWGFYQLNSYFNGDGDRFVYKTNDTTPTNILKSIQREIGKTSSGKPKYNISLSTVKKNIKLYYDLGLIWDGTTIDKYGREVDVIFLKSDFEKFQLIPYETLRFLMNSTNGVVIKLYVYLLNKHLWKQKTNDKYVFTKKELGGVLGYSDNSNTNTMLSDIMLNLKNNGLIDWVEYHEMNKDGKPMMKHKLTYVGTIVKGMEKKVEPIVETEISMVQQMINSSIGTNGEFVM